MIDLHVHTHYSDGSWSPSAVVDRALELGLTHVAIADHDTVDGTAEAIERAAGRLQILPAVELSSIWSGLGKPVDLHLLGYFIDVNNEELKSLLAMQAASRQKLVSTVVQRLERSGVQISEQKVRDRAGIGMVGRPHIAAAIAEAGGAADAQEAYKRFLDRSSPEFIERDLIEADEVIDAIRAAGGVACLAHPGKEPDMLEVICQLKHCGLQAIEAYHRRHSLNTVRQYIRFANKNGLIVTGGSDCHGPQGNYAPCLGSISVPLEVVTNLQRLLN